MSNVILCLGKYATTPYFVTESCIHLFSIEELCFFVYNNAFLLDDSFVNDKLADWIENELELKNIADTLRTVIGKGGALENLVRILNNEVGYYQEDEWKALLVDIDGSSRMSLDSRKKIRADGLLDSGRYVKAMEEYEGILLGITEQDEQLIAGVYHNLGVCAAKLFLFDKAATFFEKAYETYANTESYQEMLWALKLSLAPTKYLDYLADHKESYEDSLEVERKLEILRMTWGEQPSHKYLKELAMQRSEGGAYYSGLEHLADEVKEQYRSSVNGTW